MSTERCWELLDWTARQLAADKRGRTPEHLAPILDRLGLASSVWCELVSDFGRLFASVAGRTVVVDRHRSRNTHRRFRLRRRLRELIPAARAPRSPDVAFSTCRPSAGSAAVRLYQSIRPKKVLNVLF